MKRLELCLYKYAIICWAAFMSIGLQFSSAIAAEHQMGQVQRAVEVHTRTFRNGSLLVLQNRIGGETSRIAMDTRWGGSIVEVSLDGRNFVNEHDTGREVQPAFYDGSDGQISIEGIPTGWDPVLGGDKYDNGTPLQAFALTPISIYTRAQPLQWNPDSFGGGPTAPVAGDMQVEQTISAVPNFPRAFRVHWQFTYLGSEFHGNARQELPAVYTVESCDHIVFYGGPAPWTGDALTALPSPSQTFYPWKRIAENWMAAVDAKGVGLTVYEPAQYPWATANLGQGTSGPNGSGFDYFVPASSLTIQPGFVFTLDFFLIAGDVATARQIIYSLHAAAPAIVGASSFSPQGSIDTPTYGNILSGTAAAVGGWAFGQSPITAVDVLVDGGEDGSAVYNLPEPFSDLFLDAPLDEGFMYVLDTTKYSNGPHTVNVRVSDSNGNIAVLGDRDVTIAN